MTRQELFSEEIKILEAHFQTKTIVNLEATDESELFNVMVDTIEERIQNFNQQGSNWRFQRVLSLDVHLVDYIPLRGSSYIKLPKFLRGKKAVINIQNKDDNQCFKWSVLRHLHPCKNHPERLSSLREYENNLDFTGIEFPVKIDDISTFEKRNQGISVNVYGYEARRIYPKRFSKKKNAVNLLFISDGKGKEYSHYCLIKDFSRLVSIHATAYHGKLYFCRNCMNHFNDEDGLERHETDCWKNEEENIIMPKDGEKIKFKNHCRSIRVPFVIYVEFEAVVKLINTCEPNGEKSFTERSKAHAMWVLLPHSLLRR